MLRALKYLSAEYCHSIREMEQIDFIDESYKDLYEYNLVYLCLLSGDVYVGRLAFSLSMIILCNTAQYSVRPILCLDTGLEVLARTHSDLKFEYPKVKSLVPTSLTPALTELICTSLVAGRCSAYT